jgi:hypothetical protein
MASAGDLLARADALLKKCVRGRKRERCASSNEERRGGGTRGGREGDERRRRRRRRLTRWRERR